MEKITEFPKVPVPSPTPEVSVPAIVRPPEAEEENKLPDIELTDANRSDFAQMESCQIDKASGQIEMKAAYNIFIARILGPTTNGNYPTVHYDYNGKTYTFNGQIIAEYDLVFSALAAKGITVTAILLNNHTPSYPQMIHPLSRNGSASPYYAFNAAEAEGVEHIAAIGSFLAERYSGNNGYGKVSSWIVGNEVNARKEWNHMEKVSVAEYTDEYAKAFRVFYNAIKSVAANAKVYISLDQQCQVLGAGQRG